MSSNYPVDTIWRDPTCGCAPTCRSVHLLIELVYPQAGPTRIQWAAMLPSSLCRSAGGFSLDALIQRLRGRSQNTMPMT